MAIVTAAEPARIGSPALFCDRALPWTCRGGDGPEGPPAGAS